MQTNWGKLLNLTHRFYRSQWLGVLPNDYIIAYWADAFTDEVRLTKLKCGDISIIAGQMKEALLVCYHHKQCSYRRVSAYTYTASKLPCWPSLDVLLAKGAMVVMLEYTSAISA